VEFFHDYCPARSIPVVFSYSVSVIETDDRTARAMDALCNVFHRKVRFNEEFQNSLFLPFSKRSSLHVAFLSASSLPKKEAPRFASRTGYSGFSFISCCGVETAER
jgi:hypothetical protein